MKSLTLFAASGISAIALGSAAHAADAFYPEAPIVAGVVESGNFDGAFIGLFGGGALSAVELDSAEIPEGIFDLRPDGWLLGVDAGFNFNLGNGLVLGVVGDLAWTDQTDDFFGFGPETGSFTSTIDWLGSIRARAGYDAGNFMPYLTAGLAAAHNTIDLAAFDPEAEEAVEFTDDATHIGWTIGAGVEFAATDSLSIDVGYRYSDYGSASYEAPFGETEEGTEADFGITAHQLTVGLHYGF